MLFEVFPADNPPVPIFGIGRESRPEVIGKITFTVPVNTVRHAARNLQAFHLCACAWLKVRHSTKRNIIQHILFMFI